MRKNASAFHPNAKQEVLDFGDKVFSFMRTSLDGTQKLLVINNISNEEIKLDLPYEVSGELAASSASVENNTAALEPYGFMWILVK